MIIQIYVMQQAMARTQRDKINAKKKKKMVSVALQVVIASRDNRAVLLNLIYSVIVPPPPLSFSCCITECENSALFSLRGRNLKTSES